MELHSATNMDSLPAPANDATLRALQEAIGAQLSTSLVGGGDLPQLARIDRGRRPPVGESCLTDRDSNYLDRP